MKILNTLAKKFQEIQELRKRYEENKEEKEARQQLESGKTTESSQTMTIDISAKTLIKIILIFALFLALQQIFFQLQSILVIAAISFFLAIGLSPVVAAIESFKIPRPLAILILYLVFFGGLGILFVKIIPILAEQLLAIASDVSSFIFNSSSDTAWFKGVFKNIDTGIDAKSIQDWIANNLTVISKNLQSAAGSAFGIMTNVFKGVFNFIFALVLLFFILLEREQIAEFALSLFPSKDRRYLEIKSKIVQKKMSAWFKAQIILMLSVGFFMYAGMKILEWTIGMQYAATIGLLAGFMELFPYLGVLFTGILAGVVALNISWVAFVAVVIWIIVTQFLEGNVLVPMVMEKVVGISSVATLLALSIGGVLGYAVGGVPLSIMGMIFAVPIAASISIFVDEYVQKKK